MKIIILAAGYATRLEPLTLTTPKSLLDVGGKKIIDRILDKTESLKDGVESIYIVTNEKFFNAFDGWLKSSKYALRASLLNDGSVSNETRLGAIKDLDLVITKKAIDGDLLVVAGDNLFDLDLNKFIEFAKSKPDGVSIALYDIKSLSAARSFGVLKVDPSGRVVDFEEKPAEPKSTLISTGIYYFPKDKLAFIKKYVKIQNELDPSALRQAQGHPEQCRGTAGSGSSRAVRPAHGASDGAEQGRGTSEARRGMDAPGFYIGWLVRNDRVYGYSFSEDWYDIGNLESLKKADADYLRKERGNR